MATRKGMGELLVEWMYPRVGARIRALRESRKVTQEHLGELIGLTRTSVVNIERGRQKIMLHSLYAVAEVLGVAVAELLPSASEASVEEQVRADPVAQQDPSVLRFLEQALAHRTHERGRQNGQQGNSEGRGPAPGGA